MQPDPFILFLVLDPLSPNGVGLKYQTIWLYFLFGPGRERLFREGQCRVALDRVSPYHESAGVVLLSSTRTGVLPLRRSALGNRKHLVYKAIALEYLLFCGSAHWSISSLLQ